MITLQNGLGIVLGNVPIIALALAVALPFYKGRVPHAERMLAWLLFLGLGLPMIWAAYYHLLQPDMAARLIGWAPSPFQREVGLADLAMGVTACVASTQPLPFKAAIVWTLVIALGGDAVGHILEILRTDNLAPGNAGSILWWDILAPLYGLILLFAASRAPAR
ncbi:DUF6790 family protein [Methylobacterium sp. A49B]